MSHYRNTVLIALLLFLPISAAAASIFSERAVRYQGDATASKVCDSVVRDDPVGLDRLLQRYRATLLYGYRFSINSNAVAGAFLCNDLALLPFADYIGAEQVSSYLRGGVVTMEELLTSAH